MSELVFRTPRPDELAEFLRVPQHSYGMDGSDADAAIGASVNETDRSYGAIDGDQWVAGAGAFSHELTLPGGAIAKAAGITMVGVAPTHRRRGILTEMLRWLHEDAERRGEPLALLTASEASIYPRFGYGVATEAARLRIPAAAVCFDPPLIDDGSWLLVDPHEAQTTDRFEAIFDVVRRTRTGWLKAVKGSSDLTRSDPESERHGRSTLRGVVHLDVTGAPDGYTTWRIAVSDTDGDRVAANVAHIEALVGTTDDVEAALWKFLADIDLVTMVEWDLAPCEPSIRWRLVEPRQLRTLQRYDLMWARLFDVPAVLAARTYGIQGSLVLAVDDPSQPDSGGTFRLEAGADGSATCTRLAERPSPSADLSMAMPALSSISLGGLAPSSLAAARRITGCRAAIELADLLFVTRPAPYCPYEF